MIRLARIPPYRPCDWRCGRKAEFEISAEDCAGPRRVYCCRTHLGPAALRAADTADGRPLAPPAQGEEGRA